MISMEFSSPLAAMQPPPRPFGGFGRDITNMPSRPRHGTFGGKSNFNFRDMSMNKPKGDYFSLKTGVRGSSPTASLAADLSQNMHIDQSPQLPTPRRSLFTSGIFTSRVEREGATTPPIISWEGVTTPPIPSSSPGYLGDSMDISPLPHKQPFSFVQEVPSPTPSPDEDMISLCDTSAPTNHLQVPLPEPRPLERKRSTFLRPSLQRSRFASSIDVPRQPIDKLPAFRFGAGGNGLGGSASTSSLDECFKASPPQARNPFDSSIDPPPRRPLFGSRDGTSRGSAGGSPVNVNVHIKRSVTAMPRPRKQFRRSLSMFEHPGDVMKQEKEYVPTGLSSIMDIDECTTPKLPHFVPDGDHPEHGSIPRINHDTMVEVLDGKFREQYSKTIVVDCRFEYEYEGGHIRGALNYNDKEQLAQHLFNEAQQNTLIILHCEYSNHRAPLMAAYIRKQDRAVNAAQYPKLSYPDMYILDGGYSSFFDSHRSRCYPEAYVLMTDVAHESACERGLGKIKQRAKLSRAQTFAFGQSCHEDSPSRAGQDGFDLNGTPARMQLARRMPSY